MLTLADADALVLALTAPAEYEDRFGVSAVLNGDMDGDGDLDDIARFVLGVQESDAASREHGRRNHDREERE